LNQGDSLLKNIQSQISKLKDEIKQRRKILRVSEKILDLFKQKLFTSIIRMEDSFQKITDTNSDSNIINEMSNIFQYSREK